MQPAVRGESGRSRARATGWLAGCASLLVACGDAAGSERRRPDLILITVDTLRADHLSFAGYPRQTSPFLDRLARESFVFADAVSQCGTTPQSLSSLMTGLYPYADGIVTQNDRFVYLLQGNRTLAGILRENGYQTHAISSSIQAAATTGLDLGFETFEGASFDLQTGSKRQLRATEMSDRAIAWLRARDDRRPYFLWLHYVDPHAPYQAPAEYAELWADEPRPAGGETRFYRFDNARDTQYPLDERELFELVADYDREIRHVDDQLARLFREALEPELEHALLVFSADHGEALGQHGLIDHNDLFEGVLQVPLLIRLPGPAEALRSGDGLDGRPASGVIDTGVMLVDVLPTVLELLDVPPPGPLRGVSLTGLFDGAALDPQRLRIGEYPDHRAVYYRSFKLVERGFDDGTRYWLYDVRADPGELRDLGRERRELSNRLFARLRGEVYGRALGAPAPDGPLPEVTPEMLQELRDLGY